MTLTFTTAFGDAVRMWRRDSTLLLPLAGATMFFPQFAVLLLIPPIASVLPEALRAGGGGAPDPAVLQAATGAVGAWLGRYSGWYALAALLGIFGTLGVIAAYLMPGKPTLGAALARAGALLLRYLLATLLIGFVGLTIVLPGFAAHLLFAPLLPLAFYVSGRTMLTGPVIVAAGPIGAVAAIQRSWALTRGHGWMLGATYAAPFFAAQLISGALLSLGDLGGGNPVVAAITNGLTAAVVMAALLTLALVEVALYRRLVRTGT